MLTDIEIAQQAQLQPITAIAAKLGIPEEDLTPYGRYKAKVSLDFFHQVQTRPRGKLVLVTGINPTAAGEGKSTVTVGLGDGLRRLGRKAVVCLREPSLGPCFGMKGGAAGGGYSQVVPMEDINLHFTGDIHAVTTAHNLLSALLDNHLQQGNALAIDVRRIYWPRVLDMNDRALRNVLVGLGGTGNGIPRETGFLISVASEVMAVLCLAESLQDLRDRLGEMVIAETRGRELIRARDIGAHGAMTVLLKDALAPNLVQTLEGTPAFVHGGPFANIAHGCNSVMATKLALGLGEVVLTEAGFGADLGAEKFFDIKCRKAGLQPDAAVVVVSLRALKLHGGVNAKELAGEDVEAVTRGAANLQRHLENLRGYGVPVLVAYNRFGTDSEGEVAALAEQCQAAGVEMAVCNGWEKGGEGTQGAAEQLMALLDAGAPPLELLYPDELPLWDKVEAVAKRIYRADSAQAEPAVRRKFETLQKQGFGHLPVCVAKTQYSFSANPRLLGAPEGFDLPVRDILLSAGAGFVVVLAGDIMTMPGLPRKPAAESIDIDDDGRVVGLF